MAQSINLWKGYGEPGCALIASSLDRQDVHGQQEEKMEKAPFDIHKALESISIAVRPFPKAALFELYHEGFRSSFEQLIACIISIRTLDETTLIAARNLFAKFPTPQALAAADVGEIDRLINSSTFHERKAGQIRAIARSVVDRYHGELPCDEEIILAFAGVGVKCANLTLGIACGQVKISVDIHVHRVTNRWGYINTSTPERSMEALMEILPRAYWIEINRLLVPFGKHICTGFLPHCSTCPVLSMCRQVGVVKHR